MLTDELRVEYRTIVVPVVRSAESEEALLVAARLAAERRSPGGDRARARGPDGAAADGRACPRPSARPNDLLDDARALVESYGVRAVTRLERARSAGPAIVADAASRAPPTWSCSGGAPARHRPADPGVRQTVRHVLKHSPCRVIVATAREEAAA